MDPGRLRLSSVADQIVRLCVAVTPGEQVAVVADLASDFAVIEALTAAVLAARGEPTVVVMPQRQQAGDKATAVARAALAGADVILAPTTTALGFNEEFNEALRRGAAVSSSPASAARICSPGPRWRTTTMSTPSPAGWPTWPRRARRCGSPATTGPS